MDSLVDYDSSDPGDDIVDDSEEISVVDSNKLGEGKIHGQKHKQITTVSTRTKRKWPQSVQSAVIFGQDSQEKIDDDFFGLESNTESSDEEKHKATERLCESKTKGSRSCRYSYQSGEANMSELPDGEFWQGSSYQYHWQQPDTIWTDRFRDSSYQNQNNEKKNYAQQVDCGLSPEPAFKKTRIYIPKCKQNASGEQKKDIPGPLAKSCYNIHHNIAPFLHQNPSNRVPKNRLVEIKGHAGVINKINWCQPQHSHLLASASMDSQVKIWNVFSTVSHCVQMLNFHKKAVKDVVWSSTGREVLSCGYDRVARLCDVEKGVQITQFDHQDFVTCAKFHPIHTNLFVTGSLNCLFCWDQRNSSQYVKKYVYKDKFGQVEDLTFLPDGREFFTCNDLVSRDSADRNIMAWDFNKGVVVSNQIYQERYTCTRLKIHPHGHHVAAQTQGNYIALFATARPYKMDKCKRFDAHQVLGYKIGLDISQDGSIVVSGSQDGNLYCYDYHSTRCLNKLHLGRSAVCLDVAFHPVLYSTVAASTWTGNIVVWQ